MKKRRFSLQRTGACAPDAELESTGIFPISQEA